MMCANVLRQILSCNLADLLSNTSFCTNDLPSTHANCRPVVDHCGGIEKIFPNRSGHLLGLVNVSGTVQQDKGINEKSISSHAFENKGWDPP